MHSKQGVKSLEINLTDESDPYFLYSLEVGEEDFHLIKHEQNLLIEFHQFPVKLIELFDLCGALGINEMASASRFIIQLTAETYNQSCGTLSIIETNSFKHITHLSMKLIPGNDSAIKKYLASLVQTYKEEVKALSSRLCDTNASLKEQIHGLTSQRDQLKSELDAAKQQWLNTIQQINSKHNEEMNKEKDKNLMQVGDLQRKHELEKNSILTKSESKIQELSERCSSLEIQNQSKSQLNFTLESQFADLKQRNDLMNQQLDFYKKESEKYQKENKSLFSSNFEFEKDVNRLQIKISALEQKIQDKEEVLSKTSQLLEASNQQKFKIEQELQDIKVSLQKAEESCESNISEIKKANEIITKLQNELRNSKAKLKTKSQLISQQEKLLEERGKSIEELNQDKSELKKDIAQKEQEIASLKSEVAQLNKSLNEQKTAIETNEHVIEWLHKQINEESSKGVVRLYDKNSKCDSSVFDTIGLKFSKNEKDEKHASFNVPLLAAKTSASTPNYSTSDMIRQKLQSIRDHSLKKDATTVNSTNTSYEKLSPERRMPFKPINSSYFS